MIQVAAWQFKGWPWSGDPVQIFAHIAAFHLAFDDMPIHVNVHNWGVHVLKLSKLRRHLDRVAMLQFWDLLDRHIIKHKPYLRF
jgi:parafibromin